jgi:hypothetical protein
VRSADIDTPRGYYEWEPIKRIAQQPELLDDPGVEGKAIKCISMLLRGLPAKHSYKVIFLVRPIEEVAVSQHAMLNRLHREGASLNEEQLLRGLRAHRDEVLAWLRSAAHIELLEVDYPTLVRTPDVILPRIRDFLSADRLPFSEAMREVIDPSLYRNRSAAQPVAA